MSATLASGSFIVEATINDPPDYRQIDDNQAVAG
jgi:hypothetical protein